MLKHLLQGTVVQMLQTILQFLLKQIYLDSAGPSSNQLIVEEDMFSSVL